MTKYLVLLGVLACQPLPTTSTPADGDLFDAPLPGLTRHELAAFLRGDEEFGRRFAPSTGLGPLFNNVSCASCHSRDGRGSPATVLLRIGEPGNQWHATLGGPQIQDKAIPGITPDPVPQGVPISRRLPPPVFGMGLLEAIPDSAIVSRADPGDSDGDGISGRPNWVITAGYAGAASRLGRFGRKAQVATLLEQTVEAYHQDIGITSDFRPFEVPHPASGIPIESVDRSPDPEITSGTIQSVVHYLRTLAPPAPAAMTPELAAGSALFETVGCTGCHVPVQRTGASPLSALAHREVTLYSDLLLHDLGDALADGRPDGDATGREWRTAPLWGLRLMERFLDGQAFLLHDGRARSVEEAIALHGGEAAAARASYQALSAADRAALVAFVRSR